MNVANYLSYNKLNIIASVIASEILKHCHIHIVLVQLYGETNNDFNVLFVLSLLALSLLF